MSDPWENSKVIEPGVNELHSTWRNGFDFHTVCKPWKIEPSLRAELIYSLTKKLISLCLDPYTRDSSNALGKERDRSALLYETKAP